MTDDESNETEPEDGDDGTDGDPPKRRKRRPKKDKVLHTRVPQVLEEELKALATSWRVPVSNVVRTLLEDAIDVMSAAEKRAQSELRSLTDRLGQAAPRRPTPATAPSPSAPLEGALGVTELTLVSDSECGVTGQALKEGEPALLVHFSDGRPPLVVSPACRALLDKS